MTADTLVEPEVQTTDGDHDRLSHYIWSDNPHAAITAAMVTGTPLTALCGKTWVPARDPERYPVCKRCNEIRTRLIHENL